MYKMTLFSLRRDCLNLNTSANEEVYLAVA
nr:MAG TPA: hypothetical protein [Caudoviricetes sp.]